MTIQTSFEAIRTPRLELVAATPASLQCQKGFGPEQRVALGEILHATVPEDWPHENWEAHVLDYLLDLIAADPEASGWCRYIVFCDPETGQRTLIGTCGSGFPKKDSGEAEIGYGLLPAWQRQGFAPEAVAAMLPWLQTQRRITAFVAQTFPHLRGSIRVLEKCGFAAAGEGYDEGAILFRLECEPAMKPSKIGRGKT